MKIGIVGLGLIGGSLLKALRENVKGVKLVGISRSTRALEYGDGLADKLSKNIANVRDCDFVFIADHIGEIPNILDELEKIVSKKCIVSDVGSVKAMIMKKARPYVFIGGHPMAGTERRGFENSFAELFKGVKWVLTPKSNESKSNVDKLKKIIESVGAKTIITTPKKHDEAVAIISHMPSLLANALMMTLKDNKLAKELAAGGFRDMTRLALQNTDMAADMKRFNGENMAAAVEALAKNIYLLESLPVGAYHDEISAAKSIREKMYDKDGRNIVKS
ncbi:MAG: prephenate dehydrogenase/arogenate dehydrogenase family protein [Alphaproteobacteria bacterium]|nr:prephenate dehydrogenase/arogenate dehydrogenase family protein [Alphaproteobacteria bacterium]